MAQGNEDYLTGPQVAKLLGVHEETVRGWIVSGAIGHVTLPSGARRVPREELERFLTVQHGVRG